MNAVFLAAGGSMLACRAKAAFRDAGIPDWLLTDLTHRAGGRQHLLRVPNPAGKIPGCCKWTSCRSGLLTLVPCPHCGGWATLAARAPEVPGGLLCPDCLRTPTAGSPVFPSDYGLLSDAWVQQRQRSVAPDLAAYRAKDAARAARRRGGTAGDDAAPAAGIDMDTVRTWAENAGMRFKRTEKVPQWVADLWAQAVRDADAWSSTPALPTDANPAAVRRWAVASCHAVPTRGRLPDSVWTAYQDAVAAKGR